MQALWGLVTVVVAVIAGAVAGFGLEQTPLVSHLFLDEMLCGALTAGAGAAVANLAAPNPRPVVAALALVGYGTVMGFLLAAVWYCFDWGGSLTLLGGLAGLVGGIPAAVSFGLFGGEPRIIGAMEYTNLMLCLGLGLIFGLVFLEDGDLYLSGGVAALASLLPAMSGGRINPWDYMGE